MKLHLNLSHPFHFGHQISKTAVYSNHESKIEQPTVKFSIKKVKTDFNKLKPNHWYDGVWENLDYKI